MGQRETHLPQPTHTFSVMFSLSVYRMVFRKRQIGQLKKAPYENRLPDKLRTLGKYKLLVIDEIGYLPMDIHGANLFFQLYSNC